MHIKVCFEPLCFFPNSAIFSPIEHYKKEIATDILYKKEIATDILFHPFIPIQQIKSPRTPYIYRLFTLSAKCLQNRSTGESTGDMQYQ